MKNNFLHIRMPLELITELKHAAINQNITQQELVKRAVEEYLKRSSAKK